MDKKFVLSVIVVIVAIFGLMFFSKPYQKENLGGGSALASPFVSSEKIYDFGTISMKNGDVEKIFRVVNSADKDINLKKVTTSCMCTKAYVFGARGEKGPFGMPGMGYVPPANEIIKAGQSVDIKVVYDPNAHGPAGVGPIDRFVYLEDESGGVVELEIKALVTP